MKSISIFMVMWSSTCAGMYVRKEFHSRGLKMILFSLDYQSEISLDQQLQLPSNYLLYHIRCEPTFCWRWFYFNCSIFHKLSKLSNRPQPYRIEIHLWVMGKQVIRISDIIIIDTIFGTFFKMTIPVIDLIKLRNPIFCKYLWHDGSSSIIILHSLSLIGKESILRLAYVKETH